RVRRHNGAQGGPQGTAQGDAQDGEQSRDQPQRAAHPGESAAAWQRSPITGQRAALADA
ncbi:hypothetical protein Dimus_027011, partial [Dionaea muscipula]